MRTNTNTNRGADDADAGAAGPEETTTEVGDVPELLVPQLSLVPEVEAEEGEDDLEDEAAVAVTVMMEEKVAEVGAGVVEAANASEGPSDGPSEVPSVSADADGEEAVAAREGTDAAAAESSAAAAAAAPAVAPAVEATTADTHADADPDAAAATVAAGPLLLSLISPSSGPLELSPAPQREAVVVADAAAPATGGAGEKARAARGARASASARTRFVDGDTGIDGDAGPSLSRRRLSSRDLGQTENLVAHFQVSARTGQNIYDVFEAIATLGLEATMHASLAKGQDPWALPSGHR